MSNWIEEGTPFGGFWVRVAASFIDTLILLLPSIAITLFVPEEWRLLITLVIYWFYYAILESSVWQATLGKRMLGLKVVGRDGEQLSFMRATGRWLAKIISTLTLMIGYLMVGWSKYKRGLHDMIAGTYVIRQ